MNFFRIVKNEFFRLINNKYAYVILLFLFINLIISFYSVYDAYSGGLESQQIVSRSLVGLSNLLAVYGGVVVLMIGFSSMTDEFLGNALNTLLVKPVYRDTIINAKLMGCLCYILCIFSLTSILYVSILLIFCSSAIVPVLTAMLIRLPLVIIFALLSAMVFFSLAVFIRITISDNTAALLLSIIAFLFIDVLMPNGVFVQQVGTLLGMSTQDALSLVAGLTPWWSESQAISGGLFSLDVGFIQAVGNTWPEFLKLALISMVITILSYIAFTRRDIA